MQEFIAKQMSGFDRLVLAGVLPRLDVCQWQPQMKALRATAMEQYCWHS